MDHIYRRQHLLCEGDCTPHTFISQFSYLQASNSMSNSTLLSFCSRMLVCLPKKQSTNGSRLVNIGDSPDWVRSRAPSWMGQNWISKAVVEGECPYCRAQVAGQATLQPAANLERNNSNSKLPNPTGVIESITEVIHNYINSMMDLNDCMKTVPLAAIRTAPDAVSTISAWEKYTFTPFATNIQN